MISSSFIILSSLLSFALGDLIPPNSSNENSNASFRCPDIRSSSDSSSSSHSCDSSSSSDFCSSSSSSEHCDPCCSGVCELTYQAPFDAGIYLSSITQKFTPCDVFGQGDFCFTTGSIAYNLGVDAVLVGSDGLNTCSEQISNSANTITKNGGSFSGYTQAYSSINTACTSPGMVETFGGITIVVGGATATGCRSSITGNLPAIEALASSLIDFQHYPIGQTLGAIADSYLNDVYAIINAYNSLYAQITPTTPDANVPGLYAALPIGTLNTAITNYNTAFSKAVPIQLALPYGTYYDISRAWALNKPTYSIISGIVSAANSIYDCYGDYRAIYLAKPLSQMPYIKNSCRRACFECCNDKSRSCTALCGGLKPPGFNLPFKI